MYNAINQEVRVLAEFYKGKIIPKIFKWHNRDYKVREISLYYIERSGTSLNHCFGIETEDGGVFKVEFNNRSLVWTLQEVWID